MKIKIEQPVPVGQYLAVFEGVEAMSSDAYGPGLAWRFAIQTLGPHYGRKVARITSPTATQKNAAGKMLRAIVAPDPDTGEVDIDQYRGRLYQVVLEATDTGGTRVGMAWAANPSSAPPPTPTMPAADAGRSC
jgi:hypothetical protein